MFLSDQGPTLETQLYYPYRQNTKPFYISILQREGLAGCWRIELLLRSVQVSQDQQNNSIEHLYLLFVYFKLFAYFEWNPPVLLKNAATSRKSPVGRFRIALVARDLGIARLAMHRGTTLGDRFFINAPQKQPHDAIATSSLPNLPSNSKMANTFPLLPLCSLGGTNNFAPISYLANTRSCGNAAAGTGLIAVALLAIRVIIVTIFAPVTAASSPRGKTRALTGRDVAPRVTTKHTRCVTPTLLATQDIVIAERSPDASAVGTDCVGWALA